MKLHIEIAVSFWKNTRNFASGHISVTNMQIGKGLNSYESFLA